ncbi:MAG TPA: extracellular solute-binding protein [Clostridiales bacterium]|nr:extracellular solute-binding protein [Clostridiales bacterium]
MRRRLTLCLIILMVMVIVLSGCKSQETNKPEATATPAPSARETAAPEETEPSGSEMLEADPNVYATGMPIVKDKITVSIMGAKHPIHGEWSNMVFFKIMEEKTNIAFTYNTPAWELFTEQKNLAFTTGSYPEVFFGAMLTPKEEVTYGSQGILLPLEEYIDKYCPNIVAMFEQNPGLRASITAPDGHIYSLPNYTTAPLAMAAQPNWVNYEWMKALGIEESDLPTTLDGLYELLVRFKTEDPNGNGQADEIPYTFSDKVGDGLFNNFLPPFGIPSKRAFVTSDGVVKYGFLEPNFIHFLEFVNRLWEEKLIDQDSFAQDWSAKTGKSQSNLVGMTVEAVPDTAFGIPEPEEAVKYPMMPAWGTQYSPQATLRTTGLATGTFAITDKCKNVEAMMRWVDYLYSEEGSLLIHYGPEGNLYRVLPDGMFEYIIPTDGRGVEEKRGGEITPDCGLPLPKWVRPQTETNWNSVLQQQRAAQVDKKLWPYAVLPMPNLFFTLEEQEQLDIITIDLYKYEDENAVKFITGELPLSEWSKFTDQLKKMGVEELIRITQAAYDRWKAAQ